MKSLQARFVVFLLLTSCANVTFHSDPELTQKTGLKYYTAKPYLLVSRTGNKDNPVKVELIQLPDLEHPNFALYHPGWGSHQFNLTLSNGILTAYGQTADSKGPETIKAVADLASAAGSSIVGGAKSAPFNPVQAAIQEAKDRLNGILEMRTDLIGPFAGKKSEATVFISRLDALKPPNVTTLKQIRAAIDKAMISDVAEVGPAVAINNYLKGARDAIDNAIAALGTPAEKEKSDIELYEIRMEGGRTQLIRVDTSVMQTLIQQSQTTRRYYK